MTREFTFERATKNMVRYSEVAEVPDEVPMCGTIYVSKTHFGSPIPQKIRVTVEVQS